MQQDHRRPRAAIVGVSRQAPDSLIVYLQRPEQDEVIALTFWVGTARTAGQALLDALERSAARMLPPASGCV